MSIQIPQGEAREIAQLSRGVRIRIIGGPLRFSHNKGEAVNGNAPLYPEGLSATLDRGFDGPVWAYAPDSEVTLEVDKSGFSLTNTFMDLIGLDSQRQKGYVAQTTQRIPANEVVEVLVEQEEVLTPGTGSNQAQATTITADTDEVWELTGFEFNFAGDNSDPVTFNVFMDSEKSGVEYGDAKATTETTELTNYRYGSGQWYSDWDSTRDHILSNHRIDDTNGILFQIVNTHDSNDITQPRYLSYVFDVVKT